MMSESMRKQQRIKKYIQSAVSDTANSSAFASSISTLPDDTASFLFFYYPSDEYISYLMTVEELMFTDEIVCMDLFPGEDPREKIAIFELDYME